MALGKLISNGAIALADGSSSNPPFAFSSDSDTGIFLSAPGVLSVAAGSGTSASFSGQGLLASTGSNTNPSLSFNSRTDTGFFLHASTTIGIASVGSRVGFFANSGLYILGGSTASPSYSFDGESGSGFALPASGEITVSSTGTEVVRFSTLTTWASGQIYPASSVTSDPNPVGDAEKYIFADATGGAFNVTLPTASNGREITVMKTDASGNAVTVIGTINGATNLSLSSQYDVARLVGNGSNWYRV